MTGPLYLSGHKFGSLICNKATEILALFMSAGAHYLCGSESCRASGDIITFGVTGDPAVKDGVTRPITPIIFYQPPAVLSNVPGHLYLVDSEMAHCYLLLIYSSYWLQPQLPWPSFLLTG